MKIMVIVILLSAISAVESDTLEWLHLIDARAEVSSPNVRAPICLNPGSYLLILEPYPIPRGSPPQVYHYAWVICEQGYCDGNVFGMIVGEQRNSPNPDTIWDAFEMANRRCVNLLVSAGHAWIYQVFVKPSK